MVRELSLELQDVVRCCAVLGVSRSGYYGWLNRPVSDRRHANEKLALKIKQIWLDSRESYGLPRICEQLKSENLCIGKNRVQKIMKNNNIEGVGRKKFKVMTTDSNHDLPIADRVFKTEQHDSQVVKPNQFWAGDITYVATDEG